MNIFVLDDDPKLCAMAHCDKHVVKMILETAQMICTTHHLIGGYEYEIPYKSTHINHPCNRWLRDSVENYNWLMSLITHLNDEYRYRYDKNVNHKSYDAVKDLPIPDLPNIPRTRFARAMPDEIKIGQNVVKSYRNYYNISKKDIISYKKRDPPKWLKVNVSG